MCCGAMLFECGPALFTPFTPSPFFDPLFAPDLPMYLVRGSCEPRSMFAVIYY